MPWKKAQPLAWLALLSAMLLAGCAGDSGEAASLSYEGDDAGMHSDSAECDEDGTLLANGHVDEGSVEVTVTDSTGEEIYSEELEGDFDTDAEHLEGDKGEWTLTVTRGPGGIALDDGATFDGEYDVKMTC